MIEASRHCSILARLLLTTSVLAVSSCHHEPTNVPLRSAKQLTRTVDDQYSTGTSKFGVFDDNFVLTFGNGQPVDGYKFLRMDSSGEVVYISWRMSPDENTWQKWTGTVNGNKVADLIGLLRKLRIAELKAEYHTKLMDADQIILVLENGKQTKRVYCNGFVPPEIEMLRDFIDSELIGFLVKQGDVSSISQDDARETAEKAFWFEP